MEVDSSSSLANDPSLRTFGIQVDLANQLQQATIILRRNSLKNVTAHGVVVRNIRGTAVIGGADGNGNSEGNRITTGTFGAQVPGEQSFVDGIMCLGRGKYTVSHNVIDSGYQNSAGIRLVKTPGGAVVENNQIKMSSLMTSDPATDVESAAIEIRGAPVPEFMTNADPNTLKNQIRNNRPISGRARAVIFLVADNDGAPERNVFTNNDHLGFQSSLKDIVIGTGVKETTIIGGPGGSIQDNGSQTTIDPPGNYQ